jgi:hypothetical protein
LFSWKYGIAVFLGTPRFDDEVTGVALRLAAKQLPSGLLFWRQYLLVGLGERIVELRREGTYVRRGFVGRNGQGKLIVCGVRATPVFGA